jgi:hypothetical protein
MLIFAVFAKNYQGSYFGNSINNWITFDSDRIIPRIIPTGGDRSHYAILLINSLFG